MSRKLDGIKIANEIAKEKGGKCLSVEYVGNKQKLLWECNKGHQWENSLNHVKYRNQWCPYCSGRYNLNIDVARDIAKERGGKCLSEVYMNCKTKLHWECKEGHRWDACLSDVIHDNTWCRICSNKKLSEDRRMKDGIKVAQAIAGDRSGFCLSKKYINARENLTWKCNKGHIWYATLLNVKNNKSWCPECGYLSAAKKSNNSYILYHWKTGEEIVCVASYEKKTVEYFNKSKINFRWQSKTFKMPDGKTYRPDCYLFSTKKWVEIKGYFRKDAQEKWDWFHKEHSNSELWDKNKLKEMGIL